MPTINEYKNDSGYYIRARPSDAGNITYKIEHKGNAVIRERGLVDGDEISWSTIQSLKLLGIIYTDGSGTLGPGDFNPDPEQLDQTELTESDARDLLETLSNQLELSNDENAEIRAILGLRQKFDIERIRDRISEYLETHIDREGLPVRVDGSIQNSRLVEVKTSKEQGDSSEFDLWRLRVLFVTGDVEGNPLFTDHCIHLSNKNGLELCASEGDNWEIEQVAVQQMAVILPQLLAELRDADFDLGEAYNSRCRFR